MRSTRWGALALAVSVLASGQAQADMVISQVYGGGGNSGATLRSDFIELFNRGDAPVSLDGWSVQYASTSGTSWQVTTLSGTVQPGQYYLVKQADGAGGSVDLPTPDAIGTIAMAAANGKAALVASTTALSGSCPLAGTVDFVGFGTANCFEGSGATPAISSTTAAFRADAGCTDSNDNAADFSTAAPAPRNSAATANPCGGDPGNPVLSINDVALPEGDAGSTQFDFTVMLFPAVGTPVSFDIATADGTAQAGVDYVSRNLAGQIIPAGETTYTFSVDVLGNTTPEPDKTFFVNLTNASTGAITIGDVQAIGTILNDDFQLTPIGQVQGEGPSSPLLGQDVAVRGIVTARKSNGYFIQTPDGQDDGNPATSEGLFIFTTASAIPAAAQPGNLVQVTGTVAQFIPAGSPDQLPLVQLTFADTQLLGTGHPLPQAVELTLEDLSPDNDVAYLERYIGMRVSVPQLRVIAPSQGSTNTNTGTASNNGVFFATHPDLARPFREPGIGVLEATPFPDGVEPPVFDTNPERLRVQSNGQPGAQSLLVSVGDLVEGTVGVLDHAFKTYSILPDPGTAQVTTLAQVRNVEPGGERDVTVGTYNLFNLPNAPNQQRLIKTSRAICEGMGAPAVVGLQESFGEGAISALAQAINDNLSGTCPDNVNYQFIAPPNPNGSIQLALLYDVAINESGLPRAELVGWELVGVEERVDNPNGSQSVLNDRPPLVADVLVAAPNGETAELTVMVLHQRSLIGVNSLEGGPSGWVTEGERVRDKRLRASLWLAEFVEQRQTEEPDRPMVLLGDFNAFEFNDGFVDTMGIITGFPAPEDQVLLHGPSPLQVPLLNMALTVPEDERYSYVFDGNAQVLDHVLVNAAALERFEDVRLSHARINADFAIALFGDVESPARASDHDPAVLVLTLPEPASAEADAQLTSPGPNVRRGTAGQPVRFESHLLNAGPAVLLDPVVSFTLSGTTDPVNVEAGVDWSCDPPVRTADVLQAECRFHGEFAAGRRDTLALVMDALVSSGIQAVVHTGEVEAANDDPVPHNNRFRTQTLVGTRGR